MHPDVTRLGLRFGRPHHFVDYRAFKANRLIRRDDIMIPEQVNNFGMEIVPTNSLKGSRAVA
jgi:hypothetical protein